MVGAVKVEGLADVLRALNDVDHQLAKGLRGDLKLIAEVVADDAAGRIAGLSAGAANSAAGIRGRFRSPFTGLAEQNRRRVTGARPDWGRTQMQRGFIPALEAKQPEVFTLIGELVESVAASF